MNLKGEKEKRADVMTELDNILAVADKENRDLTKEENADYLAAEAKLNVVDESIEKLERQEERKIKLAKSVKKEQDLTKAVAGESASKGEEREAQKVSEKVSLGAAVISAIVNDRGLSGAEADMHAIAEAEADQTYRGIAIPSSWLETRTDITQGTSDIKPTFVAAEYVKALRERAVYEQVGAKVHNGLTGDFKIPVVAKQSVAHASAENSAAADGGANFTDITLTPVRISGFADFSNRLTLQNGDIAMRSIMEDFGLSVADAINGAMFSTSTVTNAPTSIAATSGVGVITEAAAYAANVSIFADMVDAEVKLAGQEGLSGNLAYVSATNLLGDLKQSAQVSNVNPALSGMNFNQQMVNGYRTYFTTGATLSAGVSGDFLFGNFGKVHVGFFGALNIIVDNLTQALTDQTRLVIHRNYDFKLAQGAAFVKATSLVA